MKDQLEDFIRQNKPAFDDKEPSERNWKRIEASVGLSRVAWWNRVGVWRAAAVLFMALSVYLLIPKFDKSRALASDTSLKEFNDVEAYYVQQISEKVEMIDELKAEEGLNGMTQDFKQLEVMYLVLKEEMKTRPSQKVKDALVLNLMVRIDLLNQHLQQLENELRKGQEGEKPKVTT
ncbi:hypothetical protein [Pseudochryseolinea flava]|uniref:Anti-sigma factor n=1 Tax=Pseudochryseolinea flava TaxID=2059302 RepID=A0A364Y0K9_9BACT|nr:hypothetical protein [Pseudochryseolinea flava]RAV99624.1 hypothetical protein DQQ10_18680 [Pseudochryseolinea flava]